MKVKSWHESRLKSSADTLRWVGKPQVHYSNSFVPGQSSGLPFLKKHFEVFSGLVFNHFVGKEKSQI